MTLKMLGNFILPARTEFPKSNLFDNYFAEEKMLKSQKTIQ